MGGVPTKKEKERILGILNKKMKPKYRTYSKSFRIFGREIRFRYNNKEDNSFFIIENIYTNGKYRYLSQYIFQRGKNGLGYHTRHQVQQKVENDGE